MVKQILLPTIIVLASNCEGWVPQKIPASLTSEERTWRFPDPSNVRLDDDFSPISSKDDYMNQNVFTSPDSTKIRKDVNVPMKSGHYMMSQPEQKVKLPEPLHSHERTWRLPKGYHLIRQDNVVPNESGHYMMTDNMHTIPDTTSVRQKESTTSKLTSDSYMNDMFVKPDPSNVRHSDSVSPYLNEDRKEWTMHNTESVGPVHDTGIHTPTYKDVERTWRFPNNKQVITNEVYTTTTTITNDINDVKKTRRHTKDIAPYYDSERTWAIPKDVTKTGPVHDNVLHHSPQTYQFKERTWRFPKNGQILSDKSNEIYVGSYTARPELHSTSTTSENGHVHNMMFHPKHHLPDFLHDVEQPVVLLSEEVPIDYNVKRVLFESKNHLPDEQQQQQQSVVVTPQSEQEEQRRFSTDFQEQEMMVGWYTAQSDADIEEKHGDTQVMMFHPKKHLPDFLHDVNDPMLEESTDKDDSVTTIQYEVKNHLPELKETKEQQDDVKTILYEMEKHLPDFQPPEMMSKQQQKLEQQPLLETVASVSHEAGGVKTIQYSPKQHLPDHQHSKPQQKNHGVVHIDFDDMAPGPDFV